MQHERETVNRSLPSMNGLRYEREQDRQLALLLYVPGSWMGKLPALIGNVPSEMTLLNARKRAVSSFGLDFLADELHGIDLWNGSSDSLRRNGTLIAIE
jgi:hypothetical protein